MQRTIVPGVAMWSVWQPDRNLFFNSYFIECAAGNIILDPLALDEADVAEIAARGGAAWVVITNRDHERDAQRVASRFGAKVAAAAPDSADLTVRVDRVVDNGAHISDARVVALDGLKTAGEFALFLPDRRTVLVGDALWGDPAGSLRLMPNEKLSDPARALLALCKLRALDPLHLLVGDGAPIFGTAFDALSACLDARDDALASRVNLDELEYETLAGLAAGYGCGRAEIGFRLGAKKLGYRAALLPPGQKFCPLHWHTAEEELFIVWDGEPTLRTPRGDYRLRRGDVIAFPTTPAGAHQLLNETASPCTVLMIANVDARDVCFYPNSKKLAVRATGTLVRTEPTLTYFDGEA